MYLLNDKAGNPISLSSSTATLDIDSVGEINVPFQNPAVQKILELETEALSSIDLTQKVTIKGSNERKFILNQNYEVTDQFFQDASNYMTI
jgi:hypothetical protein